MLFSGFGAITLVLWYGGRRVQAGEISAGDLIAYMGFTLIIATSLAMLSGLFASIMQSLGASERLFELMDVERTVQSGKKKLQADGFSGEVEFRNVAFSYPSRDIPVLNGVSFVAKAGQQVAICGPSGGGKTTLLSLVPR